MAGYGSLPGVNNWNWKWDDITYNGAHDRCRSLWGLASKHTCIECGKAAREWAYDGTDAAEKTSPAGSRYSPYPEFYFPACVTCHRARDWTKAKAKCKNGHDMVGENVRHYPSSPRRRSCRECDRAKTIRTRNRRRARERLLNS